MSGSLHQGGYCFSNVYERSMEARQQGDWNIVREQGFEAPPVYEGAGEMFPEIMGSADVLDDQIQASFRWQQKQQLSGGLDELPFINLQSKASESSYHQGLAPEFHLAPPQFIGLNNDSARLLEGQGLSLSLSCPESEKLGKLNIGYGELYFNGQEIRPSYSNHQAQIGQVESARNTNLLRNSRYLKAAQELLEEFCNVGRGQLKNQIFKNSQECRNPNFPMSNAGSSSSSKEHLSLSPSERTDCQRRKIKLLSMLEEVDARYSRYCEQMQAVMFSLDKVAGGGAANTYTGLARKAMSRHFRVMKDAIMEELKACCEALGEKDGIMRCVGLTRGETPRLRLVEKEYRQQARALHDMAEGDHLTGGAWRPHRGLPQRSVDLLRAWLFEHFLHPYPSETDKHVLSRQTGLSKHQVSNWFINARVRLWKPMVEEMYQQELCGNKVLLQGDDASEEEGSNGRPRPPMTTDDETCISSVAARTPIITVSENDPSRDSNIADCRRLQAVVQPGSGEYVAYSSSRGSPGSRGPGEVSLTLGLRRTDNNVPRMGKLSIRDF